MNLLSLSPDFAIPSYMNALESVWGEGNMKIIHGVGYPDQSLSHFRSSDIWASADAINEEPTGWWGRYFEDLYPDYLINPPQRYHLQYKLAVLVTLFLKVLLLIMLSLWHPQSN